MQCIIYNYYLLEQIVKHSVGYKPNKTVSVHRYHLLSVAQAWTKDLKKGVGFPLKGHYADSNIC